MDQIENSSSSTITDCANFGTTDSDRESFTGQQPMPQQKIIPSTSDVQGMKRLQKEFGYKGPLSAQYAEDLELLPISDEQKYWLIHHYGPVSHNYMVASTLSPKSRASFLLGALNEGKQSSHHSISSSSSRKRKNESK